MRLSGCGQRDSGAQRDKRGTTDTIMSSGALLNISIFLPLLGALLIAKSIRQPGDGLAHVPEVTLLSGAA